MTLPPSEIGEYINDIKEEAEMIESQVADIVLYGNGGFTWTDVWNMSSHQRGMIIGKINDNMKLQAGKEYM